MGITITRRTLFRRTPAVVVGVGLALRDPIAPKTPNDGKLGAGLAATTKSAPKEVVKELRRLTPMMTSIQASGVYIPSGSVHYVEVWAGGIPRRVPFFTSD